MTADWQVFPSSQWNYALKVNTNASDDAISIHEHEFSGQVFSASHSPIELEVRARKLIDWCAEDGAANTLPQSPVVSDQPEETIRLIPYAAAKLRVTAFPQLKT